MTPEEAVGEIVTQAFPAIARVWAEPWTVGPPMLPEASAPWMAISRAILAIPRSAACTAFEEDDVIGPAIRSRQLYRGTMGSGAAIQAEVLPHNVILAACEELAALGQSLLLDSVMHCAVKNIEKLRRGIAGKEFKSSVLTAFRGLRVEEGNEIRTPWGTLTHAGRMSAEMWQDASAGLGCSVVHIRPIQGWLRVLGPEEWTSGEWVVTNRSAEVISYSVALGAAPGRVVTATPIGSGELLPWGMIGRGGGVRTSGFVERRASLTPEESVRAVEYMYRLDGQPTSQIEVALRRVVRGIGERVDRADVLIDAVIAWENLVEHRTRPTSSVIWGMHALAADEGWSRSEITRIYCVRSDVVHGEEVTGGRVRDAATKAIDIALAALRALLDRHPEKIDMSAKERVEALGFVVSGSPSSGSAVPSKEK